MQSPTEKSPTPTPAAAIDTPVAVTATLYSSPELCENQLSCSTVKDIGEGTALLGMASLFLLAVSASITIDVLIFCIAAKEGNSNNNAFLTGYLLGSARGHNHSNFGADCRGLDRFGDLKLIEQSLIMLLATAPTIGITAGVASYYRHPEICNGFLAAWGAAVGLLVLGVAIHTIGHNFESRQSATNDNVVTITDIETPLPVSVVPVIVTPSIVSPEEIEEVYSPYSKA